MGCGDKIRDEGDELDGVLRKAVVLTNALGASADAPPYDQVATAATAVTGLPFKGYVQLDASQGASVVWFRDTKDGPWRELRAGWPLRYTGDAFDLFPHLSDPEAYAVLYLSRARVVLPPSRRRPGNAEEASATVLDLGLVQYAAAIKSADNTATAVSAGGRWVTVDGHHGAASVIAYGLNGLSGLGVPLRHGVSMPITCSTFQVAPDAADRTSRVRLLWSDGPLVLPPLAGSREISGTADDSGGAALAKLVVFQHRPYLVGELPELVVVSTGTPTVTHGWLDDPGKVGTAPVEASPTTTAALTAGQVTRIAFAASLRAPGVYFFRFNGAGTHNFRVTCGGP